MFIVIILSMSDYYGWLSVDLKDIVEIAFIFLIFWVLLGFLLMFRAQATIKKWSKMEHQIIGLQQK